MLELVDHVVPQGKRVAHRLHRQRVVIEPADAGEVDALPQGQHQVIIRHFNVVPLLTLKDHDHLSLEVNIIDLGLPHADAGQQRRRSGATASRIEMLPAATSGRSGWNTK